MRLCQTRAGEFMELYIFIHIIIMWMCSYHVTLSHRILRCILVTLVCIMGASSPQAVPTHIQILTIIYIIVLS